MNIVVGIDRAPPFLPCPFCGGDWVLALWEDKPKKVTYAKCQACGARGPELRHRARSIKGVGSSCV